MSTNIYTIKCITNLHVGSGEVNYNIVDNEVEKDSVTGLPIIHASGIKGALRDKAVKDELSKEVINNVFGFAGTEGDCNGGKYKFFDAYMLARPMRVYGSNSVSSVLVTSVDAINRYINILNLFSGRKVADPIVAPDFGTNNFLTNSAENIKVEGENTGKISSSIIEALKSLGGIFEGIYAIVDSFDGYDLPVIARNHLVNGESKNLWYEEVVPHDSVFYFVVIAPDDVKGYEIPEFVQFGGNASIGCGYTQITAI